MTGDILLVSVPATIIRSECLGLALSKIPNLSKSYLLIAECIISTAQQANPKVSGQIEPDLAHPITDFSLLFIQSKFILFPYLHYGSKTSPNVLGMVLRSPITVDRTSSFFTKHS